MNEQETNTTGEAALEPNALQNLGQLPIGRWEGDYYVTGDGKSLGFIFPADGDVDLFRGSLFTQSSEWVKTAQAAREWVEKRVAEEQAKTPVTGELPEVPLWTTQDIVIDRDVPIPEDIDQAVYRIATALCGMNIGDSFVLRARNHADAVGIALSVHVACHTLAPSLIRRTSCSVLSVGEHWQIRVWRVE